jgi:hypothetical protein
MFHLPREIIQLIFEFDSTYKEEYNNSLKTLYDLPPYNGYKEVYHLTPDIYFSHTYNVYPFELGIITSSYPPNNFYFQILRNRKQISIYAASRVKYNNIINIIPNTLCGIALINA